MATSKITRITPPQTEDSSLKFPGPSNYLALEWIESEDVKRIAYGLRVHSTLAMLAYKGLVVHQAEAGIPHDDVYGLVDALVSNVDLAAFVLAQKLDALPKDVA